MRAILKRDFVIKKGTTFPVGPIRREWGETNYEATMAAGPDAIVSVTIGESDIAECPDLFEIVEEGGNEVEE